MGEIKEEGLGDKNLGKAETPNLGKAGNPIKEEPKIEPSNGKDKPEEKVPEKPITDFKVAEIWIKSGNVYLEATENFWADRCRALGLLEFCKDIVKTAQPPKKPESKIIPVSGGMVNFARNIFKRKR